MSDLESLVGISVQKSLHNSVSNFVSNSVWIVGRVVRDSVYTFIWRSVENSVYASVGSLMKNHVWYSVWGSLSNKTKEVISDE